MEEREAIARLRRGDAGGLEALVHLYQEEALHVAYLVTLNRQLAEDIVQSVFVRVFERIDQFDSTRPFRPWFLRSVRNDALMTVSRRKHPLHLAEESSDDAACLTDPAPRPVELLEAAETEEAVWAALEELSPAQRAAVVSRYYLGLSEAEMSHRLGCPRGTVKRRLHDARKRLRSLLPAWLRRDALGRLARPESGIGGR
jgi:RNA polymerase sigma-70 factor (ECF subfamily)